MRLPWQPKEDNASFAQLLAEATRSVEQSLSLEDAGWTTLGQAGREVVSPTERIANMRASRLYALKDPLGQQAIRLWVDYTFGSGMSIQAKDEAAQTAVENFLKDPQNGPVLSANGQRKSCRKLLTDGDIFFVLWLQPNSRAAIRWIDPLEITEIITDPDDVESPMYYRRQWTGATGDPHDTYYRSSMNISDTATMRAGHSRAVMATDDGIVFHLAYNTSGQRGNPLLLAALDWIKQYRRFLASRVAIMLALTRFAWRTKVKGGQAAVDAIRDKQQVENDPVAAGSTILENLGADTTPIKTDSGAKNAYDDGRMLKLQVFAAVGISEQYFGDISTGNLATAKTVELPMLKMFQSFQQVWEDLYRAILAVVQTHAKVRPADQYVDINWPLIAPKDIEAAATAIEKMVATFPDFGDSQAVMQVALGILGIDDTAEVLDAMEESIKANPDAMASRVLRQLVNEMKGANHGNGNGGVRAHAGATVE